MRTILLCFVLAACGGSSTADDTPPGDGTPGDPAQRYEPWAEGNVWTYTLTDPKGVIPTATGKKTTVGAPADVGGPHAGQTAFLVHVEQLTGSKDVYETIDGDLDIRYESTFYDAGGTVTSSDVDQPFRLKLDESAAHTTTGATFSTTFTETTDGGAPSTKTENWRVVSDSEAITVTAGTFSALHIQRTSSSGKIQDYWYVRGVGKVRETGSGAQEEELESFTPAK
jgi:hypothetical protein